MSSALERVLRLAAESRKSGASSNKLLTIGKVTASQYGKSSGYTKLPSMSATRTPTSSGDDDGSDIRLLHARARNLELQYAGASKLQQEEYDRKTLLKQQDWQQEINKLLMSASIAEHRGDKKTKLDYLKEAAILEKKAELSAEDRKATRESKEADVDYKTALTADLLDKPKMEALKQDNKERLAAIQHRNRTELRIFERKQDILKQYAEKRASIELKSLEQRTKESLIEELDHRVSTGDIYDVRGIATYLLSKGKKGDDLLLATELLATRYGVESRKGFVYDTSWESYIQNPIPIQDMDQVQQRIANAKNFGSRLNAEQALSKRVDEYSAKGVEVDQKDIDDYMRILSHAYPGQTSYFANLRKQSTAQKTMQSIPKTQDYANQASEAIRGLYQQLIDNGDNMSLEVMNKIENQIKQIKHVEGGAVQQQKLRSEYGISE